VTRGRRGNRSCNKIDAVSIIGPESLVFWARFPFGLEMDFKVLKLLFLSAVVIAQVGCAAANESPDDSTPAPEASPSHDDSHGWGANLHGA
jgi:hypothetical protein